VPADIRDDPLPPGNQLHNLPVNCRQVLSQFIQIHRFRLSSFTVSFYSRAINNSKPNQGGIEN
jgi:hypothetical protein